MTSSPVRRCLISTFDKTGVVALARALHELGVEILSSGGTGKLLEGEGLPVTRVAAYTGSPEMLDGRVKTLHPRIHGGILADRNRPEHRADLERERIGEIDLVVVNLYPFRETVARPDASFAEIVEMIDIGGPTMIRAAAKNHAHVGVLVDPSDYETVIEELKRDGGLSGETRGRLAARAFAHTAAYDAAVSGYLGPRLDPAPGDGDDALPRRLSIGMERAQTLRYGENPHQRAAFYRDEQDRSPSVSRARQLQGKELSFNNILDFDAALNLAADLPGAGCAVIKHGNPCGVALHGEPSAAFARALACDPDSAFGGVIAFNTAVDAEAAAKIAGAFYEGVIAPAFDDDARGRLAKKKNLRLLETGSLTGRLRSGLDLRRVAGGMLAQDWDLGEERVRDGRVVTRRQPTETEWTAMEFAWVVVRHVKSNAIVYADAAGTIGIGAGQMSRVDSARIGVQKARLPIEGSVMASDAFFPFRDGIDAAAAAGIRAVVQPGGSIRDDEVIAAADEHGMAMVFTGRRHFRH